MKNALSDLFVALAICGCMTRLLNWAFKGKVRRVTSYYLSFMISGLLLLPVMTYLVGFDVMVAEYILSLVLWLVYDLVKRISRR